MTKLKIEFEKEFSDLGNLSLIVANHNGGINPVSLDDISSWLWLLRSLFTINRTKNIHAKKIEGESKLYIMQDNECAATIEEIELLPLETEDDIPGDLFSKTFN